MDDGGHGWEMKDVGGRWGHGGHGEHGWEMEDMGGRWGHGEHGWEMEDMGRTWGHEGHGWEMGTWVGDGDMEPIDVSDVTWGDPQ